MMRLNLRRLSRRLSTSLAFMLVFAIFSGALTEFFIELGKERGWYDKPSERLIAGMTAFGDFVTQTWFLIAAAFLTGLATGLWGDMALRGRETLALNATPGRLELTGEPGHLDYIVEGLQSLEDVTKILQRATKDTKRIARTMFLYSRILQFVHDFSWKRRLAARLAVKLNRFSDKMSEYAPRIAEVGKRTYENCLAVIEHTPILDRKTLDELVQFAKTLQMMGESSINSAAAMRDAGSTAQLFLRGVSREMNAAVESYSRTMDSLSEETKEYADICRSLLAAANARAVQAAETLTDPASFENEGDLRLAKK